MQASKMSKNSIIIMSSGLYFKYQFLSNKHRNGKLEKKLDF